MTDDNVSAVITSLTLVQEGPLTVAIDIRPGSALNVVNLGSHGVVPLAILSSVTRFLAFTRNIRWLEAQAYPKEGFVAIRFKPMRRRSV